MTELNLEQSEKADYLLERICNSDSVLGIDIANGVFDSNKERDFVFSILKKLNLITIITATEGDPFYLFNWNENTCHFLKSEGGFIKNTITRILKTWKIRCLIQTRIKNLK